MRWQPSCTVIQSYLGGYGGWLPSRHSFYRSVWQWQPAGGARQRFLPRGLARLGELAAPRVGCLQGGQWAGGDGSTQMLAVATCSRLWAAASRSTGRPAAAARQQRQQWQTLRPQPPACSPEGVVLLAQPQQHLLQPLRQPAAWQGSQRSEQPVANHNNNRCQRQSANLHEPEQHPTGACAAASSKPT